MDGADRCAEDQASSDCEGGVIALDLALAEELAKRAADGESIVKIIAEKGLNKKAALTWLRDNHYELMRQSQREYKQGVERGD